jgi:hypothetical protein
VEHDVDIGAPSKFQGKKGKIYRRLLVQGIGKFRGKPDIQFVRNLRDKDAA